jgi:hypothetical protein
MKKKSQKYSNIQNLKNIQIFQTSSKTFFIKKPWTSNQVISSFLKSNSNTFYQQTFDFKPSDHVFSQIKLQSTLIIFRLFHNLKSINHTLYFSYAISASYLFKTFSKP